MSDDEDFGFEMVMPFLPVQSKGGRYPDDAYVAGYEMGRLDGLLQLARAADLSLDDWSPIEGQPIHRENREQADLIAMRYGFLASFEDYDAGEVGAETVASWVHMRVRRASEVA